MWKTGNTEAFPLHPQIVTGLKDNYDLIFVTVNRFQLPAIIPELKDKKGDVLLIFMQNHWVIESELQPFFAPAEYLQSVNAGAILEVGTYDRFAHSPKRIGRMIKAYRKRVQICASLRLILKISFLRHCLYFLFPSSPWLCRKCLKIRTLKTWLKTICFKACLNGLTVITKFWKQAQSAVSTCHLVLIRDSCRPISTSKRAAALKAAALFMALFSKAKALPS